jgi:PKD repeat protein
VTEEDKNMDIESLFRSKLEGSEFVPSGQAGRKLMQKLGRKEFMRFNPRRFNIYYTLAVAAAGAAVVILSTGVFKEKQARIPEIPLNVNQVTATVPVTGSKDTKTEGSVNESRVSTPIKNSRSEQPGHESGTERNKNTQTQGNRNSALQSEVFVKTGTIKEQKPVNAVNETRLQKKIFAAFEVSASSGCLPMKVLFRNTSVSYDSCNWNFGDGGFSNERNPAWIFDNQGEYRVVLDVYGKDGTHSEASSVITVNPRPVARFELHPDNPLIPDDEIRFINTSVDGVRCKWDFGDGKNSYSWEPVHKYDHFDSYNLKLTVWSEYGCSDSVSVVNAFAGNGSYITFPNAFIPNPEGPSGGNYSQKSDEAAQIFHPVTSGVNDYQLRIFSKIGLLIFESNDINTGWDGYHKGQLCDPGVYIWKVRGTFKNGEPFVKMGDLTLIKQ